MDASSRQAFETYFDTTTGYADGVLTEDAVKAIQLSSTYKNLDLAGGLASAITATNNVKAISSWTGEIMSTKMTIAYPAGTKK